jgi:hypothetical protein
MGGRSRSKEKKESAPVDNSQAQKDAEAIANMKKQINQQNANFVQERKTFVASEDKKDEEAAAKAKEFARQQDAANQSANARSLAMQNDQDVSGKLQSTLNNPMQVGTMNYGIQSGGFNPAYAKQQQVTSMGGGATPAPMAAPNAAIAAKVNADAGGTNAVQNRYTMPNTTGLQFGGT